MTLNPLKEKGIAFDKQVKTWHDIVKRPYKRDDVDCYSRTRQILLNGIETEAWAFKRAFCRMFHDDEVKNLVARVRRIEDMQQTTNNWLCPHNQSVLDTTLGYEQVAVDLTAWLAQNEPDEYVKETYDFGLLEDFDHLYRYAQFAYMTEGTEPNEILHGMTDVVIGRPTQNHHNCNGVRIRKPYDKNKTNPQTKANILTLVSAEQQTHNFYAEHGFMYGGDDLRRTYAEICDVEEEHVTMYETLIDPTESWLEKWLIHEFTEVCNYYTCYKDEVCPHLKQIWEESMMMEVEHLQLAAEIFQKHEKRDAEEIIGDKVFETCHFESQKKYVKEILNSQIDKRLNESMGYAFIEELPDDWASYPVQEALGKDGAPTETAIRISMASLGRDIVSGDEKLIKSQADLLERGLEDYAQAPNTVTAEEYREFNNVKLPCFFNKKEEGEK